MIPRLGMIVLILGTFVAVLSTNSCSLDSVFIARITQLETQVAELAQHNAMLRSERDGWEWVANEVFKGCEEYKRSHPEL